MPRKSWPNRCTSDEVEPLESAPTTARKRPAAVCPPAPRKKGAAKHRHSQKDKVEILKCYSEWKLNGFKRASSPIPRLMLLYNCNENYPKRLWDKVMAFGSVGNRASPGRPKEFDAETWTKVVDVVRGFRSHTQPVSVPKIHAKLVKKKTLAKVPSQSLIQKQLKILKSSTGKSQTSLFLITD